MSILVGHDTRLVVQGITGREGGLPLDVDARRRMAVVSPSVRTPETGERHPPGFLLRVILTSFDAGRIGLSANPEVGCRGRTAPWGA